MSERCKFTPTGPGDAGRVFLAILSALLFVAAPALAQGPEVVKNPYAEVNWERVNPYLANFHSHSVLSDGRAEPDELIYMYAEAGYQILSISDHDNGYNHREGERDVMKLYTHRDGQSSSPSAETSWPWTQWIDEEPTRIWAYGGIESSAFYPDLGEQGMLAIRGAELSAHPHTSSLFNRCGWPHRDTTDDERLACVDEHDGLAFFCPSHALRARWTMGGPFFRRTDLGKHGRILRPVYYGV
jgi:hypothetical protein